jgi:DNA polymerase-3 subunit delta
MTHPTINKWMDYAPFMADLKRSTDRPAYILTGDEPFLIQQVKKHLINEWVAPGMETMDLVTFDGDGKPTSIDAVRLLDELATPPFLNPVKVIVLTDSGFFDASMQGLGRHYDALADRLAAPPDHGRLLFIESTVRGNHRVLRRMREAGALTGKFTKQSHRELLAWVSALCAREGLRITREAGESLIARCDRSMGDIYNDLTIVFQYFRFTKERDIRIEAIDLLCREDMTGVIFDLTDAIAVGDVGHALSMLERLLAKREPPILIQTMLARQSRDLIVAKSCRTASDILKTDVTSSPFYARKLERQARRFSMERLERMMERCYRADVAVKTGRLDGEDAVTMLVIGACTA